MRIHASAGCKLSLHFVLYDYYPFDFGDGGRSAPLVVGLGDRFAIMVAACRTYFPGMGLLGLAERHRYCDIFLN
jgi:hypothetical protein